MAVIPGRPILSGMKLVSIAVSRGNGALCNAIDAIIMYIIQHPDTVKMNGGSVEAKFISDVYSCVELADYKIFGGGGLPLTNNCITPASLYSKFGQLLVNVADKGFFDAKKTHQSKALDRYDWRPCHAPW